MNQTLKWKKLDMIECGQHYSINLETAEIRNDKTGRILKPKLENNGYKRIGLHLDRKVKYYCVHALVWIAHKGLYDTSKYVIDHANHIRTDNNINNLRLVSRSTNNINLSHKNGKMFEYQSFLPDAIIINEHEIYYCKTYDKFYRKVSEGQYREIHEEKMSRNSTRIKWSLNGKKYTYTTTTIRQTIAI